MEDMDAISTRPGESQEPFGAQSRRFGIAPLGMARGIAVALLALAALEAILILAVKGGATADATQDAANAFIILDEKLAGRRAHEHLDAGGARKCFQSGQIIDIV